MKTKQKANKKQKNEKTKVNKIKLNDSIDLSIN